jgi:23S rRNA pseudouridine2605 synthase
MRDSYKKSFQKSNLVRLNKFIASTGIASRRRADALIREGSVRVNGKAITELGTQVDPKRDKVFVNNKPVRPPDDLVYVMFNKPPQVVTTMSDPEGRPCINDYFKKATIRLFPVGRLDWHSEGLLLLTNDGEFAQKVSHPKFDVAKTYLVKLNGEPSEEQLGKLLRGISIIGGKTRALAVRKMEKRGSDKYDWIKIIIDEGRKHQVRLMFQKIGFDVKKLQRVAIGSLQLANLKKGDFKILSPDDIKKIFIKPKELREKE